MTRITLLILAAQVLMVCGIVPEQIQWLLVAAAFLALLAAVASVGRLFPELEERGLGPGTRRLAYWRLGQLSQGEPSTRRKTTFMFKFVR